jgi:hypothetical protein
MRSGGWRWVTLAAAAFVGALILGAATRDTRERSAPKPAPIAPAERNVQPRIAAPVVAPPARPEPVSTAPDRAADVSVSVVETSPNSRPAPQEPAPRPRSRRLRLDPNFVQGERIELRLFDDVALTAKRRRVDARSKLRHVWVGEIEGAPASSVTLARNGDVVCGDIRADGRAWRIRFAGDGLHEIRELDPTEASTRCGGAVAMTPPPKRKGSGAQHMDGSMDDGSAIDVLVVYTPAARAAEGGLAAIEALIDAAVAESNTALANSAIDTRFRLVGTAEVNYVESGDAGTDLDRLRETSDGYMDEVHGWRNAAGADLVSLIVNTTGSGGPAGIAYLLTTLQSWTEAWAFSVVRRSSAAGGYVPAHEMGHNLGCAHQKPTSTAPMYAYAHAYSTPSNNRTTVMYSVSSSQTIGHYSNPSVSYGGEPTGVADSEDNARCIRNNANHVANYRQTVVNGPPVLDPVGNKATTEGVNLSFTLSATDPDGDPVTYGATGLPSGAALDPQTGAFSWTPGYTQNGVYNVTFRAEDPFGGVDSETIQITVVDVDAPPVANAGPDANADVSSTVILNGSGSYDPDGLPLSYAWVQSAGPAVTLSNANTATPSFVPTVADTYVFELVVSDGTLLSAPDSVAITAVVNVATLPVPQPLSPPDGSTLPNGPVDFVCSDMGSVGVTDYEFHILHNPSGTWTTYAAIVSATPSTSGVNLPGDRLYRWMTRGRTSGTWGNYSGTFSLDLTSGPLQAPSTAPANFSASVDDSTGEGIFSWDPTEGATSYLLTVMKSRMVKKKKGFFARLVAAITGGKTHTLKKVWDVVANVELSDTSDRRLLVGPGEYRARVRGKNNFGPGPATEWTVFSW